MNIETDTKRLKYLSPDEILPNPENPRLFFRQEELENLMSSIAKIGIQVPIAVYQDNGKYYLLDGERRWRSSQKLNLKKIPALIQDKPTPLQNLLLMYNIHALREQWDYFTIASKLKRIIELFKTEKGYTPNEIELSEKTGLTRGQIRRCNLLLALPAEFHELLLQELELPKFKQKLSEDFFIEMERSLKTVTKNFPKFSEDINEIRNTLIDKYRAGTINAVTDFRQLAKIATSVNNLEMDENTINNALENIFTPNNINIKDTFRQTVEFEYNEQNAYKQLTFLLEYVEEVSQDNQITNLDDEFMGDLENLYIQLKTIFEAKS